MKSTEYMYRFRSWDYGCFYATLDHSNIDIDGAWGPWVICDENKYNEICAAIQPPYPNHYEAEKLLVTVVGAERFDPHAWIEEKTKALIESRARKNPHTIDMRSSAPSQSASSLTAADGHSIIDGISSVVRTIGDVIADGASAVGKGIGDMCD